VGRLAHHEKVPFVYRVHEPPDVDRLEQFFVFLLALGIRPPRESQGITGQSLEEVLERPMQPGTRRIVHSYLLRSLKKARYQTHDAGHFGLAAKLYCHFTSPIRRYPDLVDHRILKAALAGQRRAVGLPGPDLEAVAAFASDREVIAAESEREYHRIKAVRFARAHLGETYTGVVTGVISAGAFVELDAFPLDGLISRSSLPGPHRFDPAHFRLVSTRGEGGLGVGDLVEVLIARADVESREVDFEPVSAVKRRGPKLPMPGDGAARRGEKARAGRHGKKVRSERREERRKKTGRERRPPRKGGRKR
jgi:ribonuclease R